MDISSSSEKNISFAFDPEICNGQLKVTTYSFIIFTTIAFIATVITTVFYVLQRRRTSNRPHTAPYESFLWFIFAEFFYTLMVTVSLAVNIGSHCGWLMATNHLCRFVSWTKCTAYMTCNFLFVLIFFALKLTLQTKRSDTMDMTSSHVHFVAVVIVIVSGLFMIPHATFTEVITRPVSQPNHTFREVTECSANDGLQNVPWEVSDFMLGTVAPFVLAFAVFLWMRPRPFSNNYIPKDSSENIVEDLYNSNSHKIPSSTIYCMLGGLVAQFVFQTPIRIIGFINVFSALSPLPSEAEFYTGSAPWRVFVFLLSALPLVYCLSFPPLSRLLSKGLDQLPFFNCANELRPKTFAGFRRQTPIHSRDHRKIDFSDYQIS